MAPWRRRVRVDVCGYAVEHFGKFLYVCCIERDQSNFDEATKRASKDNTYVWFFQLARSLAHTYVSLLSAGPAGLPAPCARTCAGPDAPPPLPLLRVSRPLASLPALPCLCLPTIYRLAPPPPVPLDRRPPIQLLLLLLPRLLLGPS